MKWTTRSDLVPGRPAHHQRVEVRAVVDDDDERAAARQVLDALDARSPQQARDEPDDRRAGVVEPATHRSPRAAPDGVHALLHVQLGRCRARARRPPGAAARPRARSRRRRGAGSRRGTRRSVPAPHLGGASQRRASPPAVRYTLSVAFGRTTVPMSRPTMTVSPRSRGRALHVEHRVADLGWRLTALTARSIRGSSHRHRHVTPIQAHRLEPVVLVGPRPLDLDPACSPPARRAPGRRRGRSRARPRPG
jgi:hypothetical protein